MSKLTASQARTIADEYGSVTLDEVLDSIMLRAEAGEYFDLTTKLSEQTINKLNDLGYKVNPFKGTKYSHEITWGDDA